MSNSKPTDPLTPAEIAVFGASATRDPISGEVCEVGIGSRAHLERIAAVLRREAMCRGETPATPQLAPTPPPSDDRALPGDAEQPEPRTTDARLIHPIATSVQ
jgi:hypothetical protein